MPLSCTSTASMNTSRTRATAITTTAAAFRTNLMVSLMARHRHRAAAKRRLDATQSAHGRARVVPAIVSGLDNVGKLRRRSADRLRSPAGVDGGEQLRDRASRIVAREHVADHRNAV